MPCQYFPVLERGEIHRENTLLINCSIELPLLSLIIYWEPINGLANNFYMKPRMVLTCIKDSLPGDDFENCRLCTVRPLSLFTP